MLSMFTSALPLLLTASPLLLAIAQPPIFEGVEASCMAPTRSWVTRWQGTAIDTTVYPIASPEGVLVTSQQEMSLFLRHYQGLGRHLLLSNPYVLNQPAVGGAAPALGHCSSLESSTIATRRMISKASAHSEANGFQASEQPRSRPNEISEAPNALPILDGQPEEPTIQPLPPVILPPVDGAASDRPPVLFNPLPVSENPNNITPTAESPTPFDGSVTIPLASLPDGNYRYLSGEADQQTYTDAELRQHGGSLFVLNKTGDLVTGDLLPRFGLPGICVTGTLSGYTVTGSAYPYDTTDDQQPSAREIGEHFAPYGSGALHIRNSRNTDDGFYYAGAMLELSDFTRINAGSSLPPSECRASQSGGRDQS